MGEWKEEPEDTENVKNSNKKSNVGLFFGGLCFVSKQVNI